MSFGEILLLILTVIAGFTTWWGHRMNRRASVAEQEVQTTEIKTRVEENRKQIEKEVMDESLDQLDRDIAARYSDKSSDTKRR